MRISRIHVADALAENQDIRLSEKNSHYLLKVLRLKTGSRLILFNGDGFDYEAELVAIEKKNAVIQIHQQSEKEARPKLEIHLGIGLSKGDRMDQVLQKATELGVTEITPLLTEHSVVKLRPEQLEKKMHHWHGVIQSACEQSGRRYLPEFHQASSLDNWLNSHGSCLKMVLDPNATAAMNEYKPAGKLVFLVGPEGGLSQMEIGQALAADFNQARLGPHVLRTETAPLAAIAAAQTLWGNFR